MYQRRSWHQRRGRSECFALFMLKPSSPRLDELSKDTYQVSTSCLQQRFPPHHPQKLVYLKIKYRTSLQDMTTFTKISLGYVIACLYLGRQKIQNLEFFLSLFLKKYQIQNNTRLACQPRPAASPSPAPYASITYSLKNKKLTYEAMVSPSNFKW